MYKKERPKLSVTALLYGTQGPNWTQQTISGQLKLLCSNESVDLFNLSCASNLFSFKSTSNSFLSFLIYQS